MEVGPRCRGVAAKAEEIRQGSVLRFGRHRIELPPRQVNFLLHAYMFSFVVSRALKAIKDDAQSEDEGTLDA